MTKKEYCTVNPIVAVHGISNTISIAIHGIEYGIEDYLYCVCTGTKPSFHRLKIYYDRDGEAFVNVGKYQMFLNECVKLEIPAYMNY